MLRLSSALVLLVALLALPLTGCDSATTEADDDLDGQALNDAAETVALSVAQEPGGATDQVSDLLFLPGLVSQHRGHGPGGGFGDRDCDSDGNGDGPCPPGQGDVDLTYDDDRGVWTAVIDRERTTPSGRTASMYRVYEFQFLGPDGTPQPEYVTEGDTANTITFAILEGSGSFSGPAVTHSLDDLTGAWTITGADTDLLTITGAYTRAGTHTMDRERVNRTMSYVLEASMDLTLPREGSLDQLSGTIEGSYDGTRTVERNGETRTSDINTTFVATIEDGEVSIEMEGGRFLGGLFSGAMPPHGR
jgi:hypothetical protein